MRFKIFILTVAFFAKQKSSAGGNGTLARLRARTGKSAEDLRRMFHQHPDPNPESSAQLGTMRASFRQKTKGGGGGFFSRRMRKEAPAHLRSSSADQVRHAIFLKNTQKNVAKGNKSNTFFRNKYVF